MAKEKEKRQKPAPENRATLRRLLGLAAPYKLQFALAAVCLVVATAITLSLPLFIQALVDAVVEKRDAALMTSLLLTVIGVFLVQALFSFGQTYILSFIGERIVADLRKRVFSHLQYLSLGFYDNQRVGELTSRLGSDVTAVQSGITGNVLNLLQQVLTLLGGIVLIVLLDWRMLLAVAVVMLPIFVVGIALGGKLENISEQVQSSLGTATVVLEETLAAPRVVKAFRRERYEVGRYGGAIDQTFSIAMRRARLRALFISLITFTSFAALAVILWFGGNEVLEGRMTPGQLFSLPIYIILATGPIAGLSSSYAQIKESSGAGRRLFEILDTPSDVAEAPNAIALSTPLRGEVELQSVSFHYGDGPPVLRDLSLRIPAGQVTALVGPSGAGKTTLASLVPRFYDVQSGAVLVDGHDVRGVTLDSLRGEIAIVPQEPQLFGGTVRENIAYGRLDATDDEIKAAAISANAHEFIEELSEGYDSVVGERGVKLSGGQKQRVAIARAVLRNPRILILDEATSSLDNTSEALIKEALDRLMKGRTVIVIAHRLSTIENADNIAVLEDGRVVEEGTHRELLSREGLYYRLYTLMAHPSMDGEAAPEVEDVEIAASQEATSSNLTLIRS